jgi:hypothetical protein
MILILILIRTKGEKVQTAQSINNGRRHYMTWKAIYYFEEDWYQQRVYPKVFCLWMNGVSQILDGTQRYSQPTLNWICLPILMPKIQNYSRVSIEEEATIQLS